MNAEQRFFMKLLNDYVHSVSTAEPKDKLDWFLIAGYAEDQDLCGIVYYQCRDLKSIDAAIMERLHEGFLSDAYRAVAGEAAMARVAASLDAAGIDYLPFKGEVLRRYYPNPELRTMGDRDVLIRRANRESTDQILQELGYERSVDRQEVWAYQRHTVIFEIHDTMFYEHLANKVDYREYFERIWDSAVPARGRSFLPKPELHFLYLMAHTAKHISNYGMGFRAFLDMVFFCRREESLDWDYIRRELEQLGLYTFTLRCFSLCEAWFGVTMPLACGSIEEELLADTTEKVFRDGIFGNENQENTLGRSANEILHDGRPYALAAARLTLRHVFPPYEDLRLVEWYSWVEGRPWLMPAAWVYRWFFVLLHKPARGRERLGEAFQKKQINDRQTYLEHWGL